MTAPITPSGGGGEHTPWCGQLSCDLRNDTLAVSTDAMVIIDSNGVAWATLLPSAGGFYDHAAFIVAACNSHATLKARIEELESETARLSALWIGETRRVEELEAALKKTLGVIEQEELHGFGAHDSSCSLCRSVKDARATLASGGAAVTSTDGGVA